MAIGEFGGAPAVPGGVLVSTPLYWLYELTHAALQKLLRTGQVRIDGKRAEGKDRVEPGQTVGYLGYASLI